MRWNYTCPHCSGILSREDSIMLIGTRDEDRIIFGFHPAPGNYQISVPPGYVIEPDSRWRFFCPLCHESLISDTSEELCCIDMVTKDVPHRVYFSRTAGEHATFVISPEGVKEHGEHARRHSLELLDLV